LPERSPGEVFLEEEDTERFAQALAHVWANRMERSRSSPGGSRPFEFRCGRYENGVVLRRQSA
jgi:hypothetical protein